MKKIIAAIFAVAMMQSVYASEPSSGHKESTHESAAQAILDATKTSDECTERWDGACAGEQGERKIDAESSF